MVVRGMYAHLKTAGRLQNLIAAALFNESVPVCRSVLHHHIRARCLLGPNPRTLAARVRQSPFRSCPTRQFGLSSNITHLSLLSANAATTVGVPVAGHGYRYFPCAQLAGWQQDHGSQRVVQFGIGAATATDAPGRQQAGALRVVGDARSRRYDKGAAELDLPGRVGGRAASAPPKAIRAQRSAGQTLSAGHDSSQRNTARKRFGGPSQYRVPYSSRM